MRRTLHLYGTLPRSLHPQANHEKTVEEFKLRNIIQNMSIFFKRVKIKKNKERLRNCHKLRKLRGDNSSVQHGILDWILEWKRAFSRTTGEI